MTAIRDELAIAVGVGDRFCVEVAQLEGMLVAAHPRERSPLDIAVIEGIDQLEAVPATPVEVEIESRVVEDYVVGRLVATDCSTIDPP
ncbi:hypothetical protein [Natrialba asiatica]|uniref:Uncharacterized protein n=1 Tax=Natrialba asiatica (strain ATCC 700177 / DSM 12278 / JCM 9576 / FERM P-10747 / NBRC 102637 / 172P1) TaxID=29540 RepID=M0ATA5_NATA1|nr:hypothetical protein [Natrialba asiatica]ELZ01785.1 hypothetical protein C481_09702 [Natrialba asiatica DSM 12278]